MVLEQKMLIWDKSGLGEEYSVLPVADEFKSQLEKHRQQLVEDICSCDEALMEKFLNNEAPTEEELKKA